MFKFIALLIFVFLVLLGLSDVIFSITELILRPKKRASRILYVLLDKEFAETQVLSEVFKLRWFGENFTGRIIFLTDKLDENEILKLKNEYKCDLIEFKNGVFNGRE